jgi:hypothetical protein
VAVAVVDHEEAVGINESVVDVYVGVDVEEGVINLDVDVDIEVDVLVLSCSMDVGGGEDVSVESVALEPVADSADPEKVAELI